MKKVNAIAIKTKYPTSISFGVDRYDKIETYDTINVYNFYTSEYITSLDVKEVLKNAKYKTKGANSQISFLVYKW